MTFVVDGICKHCNNAFHGYLYTDKENSLEPFMKCPHCGTSANHQDIERMYHLLDTFQTDSERNRFIDIRAVAQSSSQMEASSSTNAKYDSCW